MKKKIIILLVLAANAFKLFAQAYDSVDVNNINARVNCDASQFWDLSDFSKFEVPQGSGINSIFAAALWVGGKDPQGQLYLAATMFNTNGKDFWPGPVMDSASYSVVQDSLWNKVWKINKAEIDFHIANWDQPGYSIPQKFLNWPAHGNISLGQAPNLAPFFDNNSDGIYNPANGDYPAIRGDQAVYFILNDDRNAHTQSGGEKLRVEIHVMAYAFDCNIDSALWNTLFLSYKIINRSQNSYDSTYFGIWVDGDLGCFLDDRIGSDVQKSTFYFYNADMFDENCGNVNGYGSYVPAQSVTFLKGPLADADGIDNNDSCKYILGVNDNITDNEYMGLISALPPEISDPSPPLSYYYLLQGLTGQGNTFYTQDSVPAKIAYPGDSDPQYCATDGIPYLPYSETSPFPGDRRGIGASGPFTFKPGDIQELDIAFVFGRDYSDTNSQAGIAVMQQRIDTIRSMFFKDSTTCGSKFSFAATQIFTAKNKLLVFPNPAREQITVTGCYSLPATVELLEITGKKVMEQTLKNNTEVIDTKNLSQGFYLVRISTEKGNRVYKIVKE